MSTPQATKQRVVLIIDDDAALAKMLALYLIRYNYRLVHAGNAEEGFKKLSQEKPEAVLLDITLPGISGLQICREIREKSAVPIIMISALGEASDRIVGLELGADDYLPKPFDSRELVARLEALFRRSERNPAAGHENPIVTLGGLVVDRSRRAATLDGSEIELSSSEFALLTVLIERPGHVFSRDDLLDALRGIDWEAYNRSVDVLISRLRRKLKDNAKNPRFLKTVWGTGYTLLPQKELNQEQRKAS